MKKISVFLFGALLVGVASAFTTTEPAAILTAYGNENGQWIQVDTSREGIDFECNAGTDYCLYQTPSFSDPLPGQTQNKKFHSLRP